MTPQELAEWQAFYELEPWGTPVEDDRWRKLYELLWYPNFKGDLIEGFYLDRDPEETARLRAKAEADVSLEDKLDAFFAPIAVSKESSSA